MARAAASRIEEDANRAANVIDSLRSFYKTGTPTERQIIDVKEMIEEMSGLLRSEADRHGIKIHSDLEADSPNILVNLVQLQQVYMNLMLNAIEAMKDTGGDLAIRSQVNPEGRLIISISDTGLGSPAGIRRTGFFRALPYDQATGDGYGSNDYPLDRGGIRRAGVGYRQPGHGRNFPFHSSLRGRGSGMNPAAIPTVYIVDDDGGVRRAVVDLVESVGLRAECFATGQEFLQKKRGSEPSCLVLDVRLPQMSGLDFQSMLADVGIQIPIIFITAHGDIPMSVRALKSGAVEFLTKPFRNQDLLDAQFDEVLQRDRVAREQRDEFNELHKRYLALTARERAVMGLVVTGMLNKQIGAEIGASESTVKIHRGNVMQKMQAGSLIELVRMADKLKSVLAQ